MQGLRTSAREPLMGGQSFSSWRRKFWRRAASEDFEFGIVCICHNIHTKARRKCKKLKSRFTLASPVSAVTEGIRNLSFSNRRCFGHFQAPALDACSSQARMYRDKKVVVVM